MLERLEQFLGARQARFQLVADPRGEIFDHAARSRVSAWALAIPAIVRVREELVMAVAPAACIIDFRGLARVLGRGLVRPVSDAEIARAVRDCAPDAIPPFGALYDMPTVVDHRLLAAREITMRAGDHRTLLRMRVTEYRRLAVPRVGDFAIPESLLGRRAIGPAHASHRKAG